MTESSRDHDREPSRDPRRDPSPAAIPEPGTPAEALRAGMECVVLAPVAGAPVSDRPAVEIFLGTEPAQYRANRVFGYSIEKVRDPGREVRIYFMSELPGFDRRGWTTGFTNYRFAIPAFCGGLGRAIYNDEDEIYRTDPGVLFDLELDGAGYLAISDSESSVMLIDCEAMASVWSLEEAQRGWKRALLRKASRATGHRGDLDPHWNARDEEFVPGRSHLLHYTTLHTQPWRPFPERFVYQAGSHTELWHALEREAIAQGFELFHREAPSKAFAQYVAALERAEAGALESALPDETSALARALAALVRQAKAEALLELRPEFSGAAAGESSPARFGLVRDARVGLDEWLAAFPDPDQADGVVCVEGLEALPVWDVPWIVDTLFARAKRFVFVAVRGRPEPPRRWLHPPAGTAFTPAWWRSHFEAAAVRYPGVRWELATTRGEDFEAGAVHFAFGGPRLDASAPRIWTAVGSSEGDAIAAEALANALGGACETFGPSGLEAAVAGIDAAGAGAPDLLIAAGSEVARAARSVRDRAAGRCLVVALGAQAALPVDEVDLAVVEPGDALFVHPRLVEIAEPLVARPLRPATAGGMAARLAAIPGMRIVLRLEAGAGLVALSPRRAEALGERVAESASQLRGVVLLSVGVGVPDSLVGALRRGLDEFAQLESWKRPSAGAEAWDDDALWPVLLEAGEVFVLAGVSDPTLATVCASGRPVFLARPASTSARPPFFARLREAIVDAIVARAQARPANDRGTTRPQEGLEWLCARLVERGRVRPRHAPNALAGRLVEAERLRWLDAPLASADLGGFARPAVSPLEQVAARVRSLLGTARADEAAPPAR